MLFEMFYAFLEHGVRVAYSQVYESGAQCLGLSRSSTVRVGDWGPAGALTVSRPADQLESAARFARRWTQRQAVHGGVSYETVARQVGCQKDVAAVTLFDLFLIDRLE